MIEVIEHRDFVSIKNPQTGQWQDMVTIVFLERGRSSANRGMSETSEFLSKLVGEDVGLESIRIHTHPVKIGSLSKFPIGSQHEGHINRKLYSTPQMENQVGRPPRIIDGQLTYFVTNIEAMAKDDLDFRDGKTVTQLVPQELIDQASVRATEVKRRPVQQVVQTTPGEDIDNVTDSAV